MVLFTYTECSISLLCIFSFDSLWDLLIYARSQTLLCKWKFSELWWRYLFAWSLTCSTYSRTSKVQKILQFLLKEFFTFVFSRVFFKKLVYQRNLFENLLSLNSYLSTVQHFIRIYELMIVQNFAKGVVKQEISVIIKSFSLVSHKDFLYCLFNEFPVKLIFIKFCLSLRGVWGGLLRWLREISYCIWLWK